MKLNYWTKRAMNFVTAYQASDDTELYHVYRSYSHAKDNAFCHCRSAFCGTLNSKRFRIISHNSQCFTCAWLGESCKTGEKGLFVETAYSSYFIPFEKLYELY